MFTSLNFQNNNYTVEYTIDTDFIIPNKKLNDITDLGFFIQKKDEDKIIEPLNIFLFMREKQLEIICNTANYENITVCGADYLLNSSRKKREKLVNLLENYKYINPYSIPITYNIYDKNNIVKTKKIRYNKITKTDEDCLIRIYINFVNYKNV